jgi:cytosine deaminase
MSALENSGRLPASAYEGATMYTTLSPCDMCTGACILYKVKRVVIGENKSFMGGEEYLLNRGKEVVVLDNEECKQLMEKFMKERPELWYVFQSRPRFYYSVATHLAVAGFDTIIMLL